MTTIAFDGTTMAADTLCVDNWGFPTAAHKIMRGTDYLVGGSGPLGTIKRWWNGVGEYWPAAKVIEHGYPEHLDRDWPHIMLATKNGIWQLSQNAFIEVTHQHFAIGSGRDYAIAAMHLGKSAEEAVRLAMQYDTGTGGDIDVEEL